MYIYLTNSQSIIRAGVQLKWETRVGNSVTNILFRGINNPQQNATIASIDRLTAPWALIKFLDLESGRLFEVGAYSRLGAY